MSKDAMRQAMPTVAQIVDQFRDLMADGGRVIFASENGHVIDRREPEPNVFDIPPGYLQSTGTPKGKK
jgi:N-acetylmuramic acid 6-phosphate (MurNAc-6-P) etherase